MSLNLFNFSLRGLADTVMFGKAGVKLKKTVTNELEARNNADSGYINLRVATPVIADDAVTKGYVDAFPGLLRSVRGLINFNDVSPLNIGSLLPAANTKFNKAIITVLTTFDDPVATVEIGRAGDTNELTAVGDIYLDTLGTYVVEMDVGWAGAEQTIATITPAAATQGQLQVELLYTTA